ncbi:MAG: hypothetical protein BalsKO_19110 [Balneolaceae bacterium]
MLGIYTKSKVFSHRLFSVVVIVGFLCIQFHSFSHINHKGNFSNEILETENSISDQITDHFLVYKDTKINCSDCVLTNKLHADLQQNTIEYLDRKSIFILKIGSETVFGFSNYLFYLRAPPLVTV